MVSNRCMPKDSPVTSCAGVAQRRKRRGQRDVAHPPVQSPARSRRAPRSAPARCAAPRQREVRSSHAPPREQALCSHRVSTALIATDASRISTISGYIVALSKLRVGEADLVADAAARQDELGADDADERVGDGELRRR